MNWPAVTASLFRADELDDRVFVYLRQYLWKGNSENKNTASYALEAADKEIILLLLEKLVELRNFHSHYWHENTGLSFEGPLRLFIQEVRIYPIYLFPFLLVLYFLRKEIPLRRFRARACPGFSSPFLLYLE